MISGVPIETGIEYSLNMPNSTVFPLYQPDRLNCIINWKVYYLWEEESNYRPRRGVMLHESERVKISALKIHNPPGLLGTRASS